MTVSRERALAIAVLATLLAPGAATAGATPKDPVILLPPAPGGEADGTETIPPGAIAEEDLPEPPEPEPVVEPVEPEPVVEPVEPPPEPPVTERVERAAVEPVVPSPAPPVVESVEPPVVEPAAPPAAIGGRLHRVGPGESLWLIAERLLGPGATAAEVAAEVERLWRLNRDRIGTGDPDLVPAGVTIVLSGGA